MNQITGDLVANVKSGIILQQVNAQGQMGSGFAKAVFTKWPVVKKVYQETLGPPYTQPNSGAGFMGTFHVVEVEPELFVVNMVTQQFFGNDPDKRYTSYDALDTALKGIAKIAAKAPVEIHHPLIGAGLGNGNWNVVKILIEQHLGHDTTLWVLP